METSGSEISLSFMKFDAIFGEYDPPANHYDPYRTAALVPPVQTRRMLTKMVTGGAGSLPKF